tara:strand:+ start:123 stop:563 length:441 start_codon:yes stop_codon:yes gene_type:complete
MSYLLSPLNNINRLERKLDRIFHESHFMDFSETGSSKSWAPQIDIAETEEAFHVVADIPGVNPVDIEISHNKGILTIKGDRLIEEPVSEGKFSRKERRRGTFMRQLKVPELAEVDNISAISTHGVLTIKIPKAAPASPVRVAVETA